MEKNQCRLYFFSTVFVRLKNVLKSQPNTRLFRSSTFNAKLFIKAQDFGFQYSFIRNLKQPVKKIWGRILDLAWLKVAVAALHVKYQAKAYLNKTNKNFVLFFSVLVNHVSTRKN